jgi:DNA helicase-2/ATP-dependent DNA helicase PcrA
MGNLLPGRLNTESGKDYETCFFREVSDLVQKEVGTLEERSKSLKETIAVFQEQYAEGDYEVAPLIDNAANSYRDTVGELKAIVKKAQKPYFGRIIFDNDSVYIGRTGIRRDQADVLVADWRAPISNAYYENGLGNVSFKTPVGDDVNINLTLKRTFDISDGKLNDYYDSEAATDDELLNKYLAKNKQAVLNEIIATIQKEQNDIIRMSPKHNLIVQGVAGSGKTTVAMHRISYLLYNYGDYLRPESF